MIQLVILFPIVRTLPLESIYIMIPLIILARIVPKIALDALSTNQQTLLNVPNAQPGISSIQRQVYVNMSIAMKLPTTI